MLYLAGVQISELTQVKTGECDGNLLKTYTVKEGFGLTFIDQSRQ